MQKIFEEPVCLQRIANQHIEKQKTEKKKEVPLCDLFVSDMNNTSYRTL